MAKALIPIIWLSYPEALDLNAYDLFVQQGVVHDDEYTFTLRVTVSEPACRERLRKELRVCLPSEQAKRLIRLLDENEWDVSFLVDCF